MLNEELIDTFQICPEFSQKLFRGKTYNNGNLYPHDDTENPLHTSHHWSYSVIEPLFDFIKTEVNAHAPYPDAPPDPDPSLKPMAFFIDV